MLLERGRRDKAFAARQRAMCAADLLYWLNAYGWTYDPRIQPPRSKKIPFITYDYQDEALLKINHAIGRHDLPLEKSRDMGATWMVGVPPVWRCSFADPSKGAETFLFVSRKEALVDNGEDPDSIFWKLRFLLNHMPSFVRPKFESQKMKLFFPNGGHTIDGSSTTGDIGRGGRRSAVILDEFAAFDIRAGYDALSSTQATTECRIFNSTPQGAGSAFYDIVHTPGVEKVRMHWSQHPRKRVGLYRGDKGKLELLDAAYWRNRMAEAGVEMTLDEIRGDPNRVARTLDYEFLRDGKLRSPWYDNECNRPGATPLLIAQELDIDYIGSGSPFFNTGLIEKAINEQAMPHFAEGELEHSLRTGDPGEFMEQEKGRLRLWCHLDAYGEPPESAYVIGADISAGTGASNSCLSVVDRRTRTKVAEFVSPHVGPEELAVYAIALGRWFKGAFERPALMVWETNGPGQQFTKQLRALDYPNLYLRRDDKRLGMRITDVPGWHTSKESKRVLLSAYMQELTTGGFTNRSGRALRECLEYQFDGDDIVHVRARASHDPSGARSNHGDIVIADALAVHGMGERVIEDPDGSPDFGPPIGSMAWRREQDRLEEAEKEPVFNW